MAFRLKYFAFLGFLVLAVIVHATATKGRQLNDAPVSVSATVVGGSYKSNKDSDIQLPSTSGLLSSILDVEVQQILREEQAVNDRQGEYNEENENEDGGADSEQQEMESWPQKVAPAPSERFDEETIRELDSGLEG
ncbi:hypothetical protein BSKO_09993 [Bryopsis sp. KO-2023]|nr:hypothetical protein BSKO_09993 [Bryopsis sp. KO-2023]